MLPINSSVVLTAQPVAASFVSMVSLYTRMEALLRMRLVMQIVILHTTRKYFSVMSE